MATGNSYNLWPQQFQHTFCHFEFIVDENKTATSKLIWTHCEVLEDVCVWSLQSDIIGRTAARAAGNFAFFSLTCREKNRDPYRNIIVPLQSAQCTTMSTPHTILKHSERIWYTIGASIDCRCLPLNQSLPLPPWTTQTIQMQVDSYFAPDF